MISIEGLRRYKKKIFTKKIKLSKSVDFGNIKTSNILKKKIKFSRFYFEYGAGATTLYAKKNNKKFISIESDFTFYRMINKLEYSRNLKFVNLGPVGEYSYPIFLIRKKILNYVQSINLYFNKKNYPNFVLIDGRFRVACCLNLFRILSKKKINIEIIIDDYLGREHYNILKNYFEVKKIGRMASLKVKKSKLDEKVFKQYLLDPR